MIFVFLYGLNFFNDCNGFEQNGNHPLSIIT